MEARVVRVTDSDELDRRVKEVIESFSSADQECKGFLTKEDYKVAYIQLFGYKPSKYEIAKIWSEEVGSEGNGLSSSKFKSIVLPKLLQRDSSEHIRQIFLAFDRFCHGFISQDDCKEAFLKVKKSMILQMFHSGVKTIILLVDGTDQ